MAFDQHVHSLLEALRAAHQHRVPLVLERSAGARVEVQGRSVIQLASNDYLGLGGDPELIEAVRQSAQRFGVGAGAARLVTGTSRPHQEAEACLAELVGAEAALVFPSGYMANVGAIPALAGPEDLVLSDALNHASLIDGCRLSGARVVVYPHRDVAALEARLGELRKSHRSALIVSESVFSMDATEAPLAALRQLADDFDAGLVLDEAHALGVIGPNGRGLAAARGVQPDVLVGTLGKALGLMGAFVAGRRATVDLVLNRARSFVFATGLSPALAGAIPTAVRLALAGDARRRALDEATRTLADGLAGLGYDVRPGLGPILPIWLGASERATDLAARLLERGVLTRAIRPPTVPAGTARLRAVPSASTDAGLVAEVLKAFAEVR